MTALDKEEARELVRAVCQVYLDVSREKDEVHDQVKEAVRRVKSESRLTQQEIADATVIVNETEEELFSLSRQRIGQILNEDDEGIFGDQRSMSIF